MDMYQQEVEKITKENKTLLKNFEEWLEKKRLAKKTIARHVQNCDFFINDFLLYSDAIPAHEGASQIGLFLGYWFIKKAMWASPTAIRENAASLKKFYTFLHENGKIEETDLNRLNETIKEEMPEWIATMDRYDDPSITDMEEVWAL